MSLSAPLPITPSDCLVEHLSAQLGSELFSRNYFVTTAESCTGGGIAQAITDTAGSSQWFSHGFVTYSNDAKQQLLEVSGADIEYYGAVSREVVEGMVVGALKAAQADVAIAVSGVAGPDGGTKDKPVGTVWIAWAVRNSTVIARHYHFLGSRKSIRNQSVSEALSVIIDLLQQKTKKNTV
jgi:nicotinamide-nucleotide amidase